ncbi:MAG: V4R domain-containing protein, partial [Thermoplasmata archaeon]
MPESIDMFALPADVFASLRQELVTRYSADDAEEIMYYAGEKCGKALVKKSGLKLKKDESLSHALQGLWWEIGFGKLYFEDATDFGVYVEATESAEASAQKGAGKMVCHFTRGYIAGIASELTGRKYWATEESCIAAGDDKCT